MTSTTNEIIDRLKRNLNVKHIDVIDDSHLHVGHPGAKSGGGHYRLIIQAEEFTGLPRVQQHRIINEQLIDLFKNRIHALSIEIINIED